MRLHPTDRQDRKTGEERVSVDIRRRLIEIRIVTKEQLNNKIRLANNLEGRQQQVEPIILGNQEQNPQSQQEPRIEHQAVHKEQDRLRSDQENL